MYYTAIDFLILLGSFNGSTLILNGSFKEYIMNDDDVLVEITYLLMIKLPEIPRILTIV
jgi:hypothetical protein